MGSTRFDDWPRWAAVGLCLVVLALSVWGFLTPLQHAANDEELRSGTAAYTDGQLYLDIADRVRAGENYYEAATELQRANDYPVRPSMSVRQPALAIVTAAVGGETGMRIAVAVMVAIVMAAGLWRFERIGLRRWEFWLATLLLAAGVGQGLTGEYVVLHEVWAGMLVVLSLLVWRPGNYLPAVVVGVIACLIREFAIAYLLVMLVMALARRARGEARAWLIAVVASVAALAVHLVTVGHFVSQGDPQSQGWVTFGGWAFTMRAVYNTTLIAPYELTALVIPLALVGWLGLRDPIGLPTAGLCAGFVVAFTVLGRPENFYWGFVFSTPLLVGLAFAPCALRGLVRRCLRPSAALERGAALTEYVVLFAVVLGSVIVAMTVLRAEVLAIVSELFETVAAL